MLLKLIQIIVITFCLNSLTYVVHANETSRSATAIDKSRTLRIALPDKATIAAASPEPFQHLVNFLKEYWQIWSIDNQIPINFIYLSTAQALEQLENNQVDIVAINIHQPEYRHLLYSIPYAKFKQSVFRNINKNDTNGIQIAIHSDDNSTLDFLAAHIEREYFSDVNDIVKNYQQYDAIYSIRPWLLTKKLEELGIKQQFYLNQEEVPEVSLHFTTRKNDRALMLLINDSIRQVSLAQANLWHEKYLSQPKTNFALTLGHYLTNLSEEEKTYILDNHLVSYPVTHEGLPPFIITKSFSNITERGFVTDLIKIAMAKTGIIYKPLYVENLEQTTEKIAQSAAKLLVNVEQSNASTAEYHFSIPYLKAHYSLVYNPSMTEISQLSDIGKFTIAAVQNFNATSLLTQDFPNAKIKIFNSIDHALKAVAEGNAQVFIGSSLITSYLIKELRLSNLTSQPLPAFHPEAQYTFASTHQDSALISLLNKTINSISADKFDAMYAKWSQSSFPQNNVQAQIEVAYRQASYVFFTIMLIALIIFWVYYRQLQVRKIAQKKIEHALAIAEAARKEAERSAQAKITFLTRMSHEIRTPMNGVLGMAEALNFTQLNKEQSELLETLEGSARHLLALLNDVLDFSKMDAGKLTLESVPVNFHLLAQNVIKSFKHVESQNNIVLKLVIDDNITHSYFTDPTRLNQVLNNLVSNAIKFTHSGSVTLSLQRIEQTSDKHDVFDTIRISVIDTGIGISPAQQQLLFTPFIQADSDTTRKFGGTGLGLSICQEIIIAMGGKITIDSRENLGSTFSFELTFKEAGYEKDNVDRRKNSRKTNAPHDDRFHDIRVLIAEDNLVNVKVLSAQLARLNIHCDVAFDGVEALALHTEKPYDIIISDCHMPNMDGFELAKILTKTQLNQNQSPLPIWLIAVTADALSGAAEKCIDAGFDDYMAKPCPQEEITNKLNHAYRALMEKRAEAKQD